MKAAIVGYGNMGREIERILKQRMHTVVSIIDTKDPAATHKNITVDALKNADVVFEFTHPGAAVANIAALCSLKKNIVVGTTGWHDRLNEVSAMVKKNRVGLIYGTNFSIGVNLFYRVVGAAASLANKVPDYDVYGYELHHAGKADSPSGTAKSIVEILLGNITRKKRPIYDRIERQIAPDELQFSSIRAGKISGTHVVGFDGPADSIELHHVAKNRSGFALGAVMAGEWLVGKKGVYTVSDFIDKYFR